MFLAFRLAQSGVRVKNLEIFMSLIMSINPKLAISKVYVPMFLSPICEVGGLAIIYKRIQPNFIRSQRGKF
jgi:hypothetical protein